MINSKRVAPKLAFFAACIACGLICVSAVPVSEFQPTLLPDHLDEPNCIGSPECPVWPKEFSSPFGLYSYFPKVSNASSMFYYKYTDKVKAQVIDYTERCFPFASVETLVFGDPCKFYFNPSGIYFSQPSRGIKCCSFVKGVGAVPPNFLKAYHLADAHDTTKDYWDRDIKVERWEADEGFKYWTVAHGDSAYPDMWGHDIVFQDGPTGVTWRWGLFNVTGQDDSIFTLPASPEECAKSCPWYVGKEGQEEGAATAAFISPPVHLLSLAGPAQHGTTTAASCRAMNEEAACEAAGQCQWCVTIDLEWCQDGSQPCKE